MRGQATATAAAALLAASCVLLLLPTEGESAGGIVPLKRRPREGREAGMLAAGEGSPDDREADGGLVLGARGFIRSTEPLDSREAAPPGMTTL